MRILVIEDDQKIADFIAKGLKESGFTVDHAANGIDGLHLALTESYDIGVFDIMLPGIDGLEIIKRIRAGNITTPVIILSARRNVDERIKGIETGADDYLTKPFYFSELLVRVQALIRRSSGTSEPSCLKAGDLSLDLLTREVVRAGKHIDLQPKEFSLLRYMMQNAERAISKTAILEHIWEYNFDPQTNAVDVLVCRLRAKIDKDFKDKLLHTLRGVGYVFKN
ncbi:MAG: response regulator transcription factor [Thermodesulfobacteriota bacterium]|nr:response regulator transcription factor [Thermodesulfobacteriota bacterium]